MSSEQEIIGSSVEQKSSSSRDSRGASSQSARYCYRRFRNSPKKQLRQQKSLATVDENNEITNAKHADGIASSILKPLSNSSVNEEDLEKRKDANAASSAPSSKASKRKICKYFAAENSCYFGEWCRFLHIRTEIKENNSEPVPSYANVKPARVIVRPNIAAISRANIGKKEQLDIRNSEINYFGRRFHDAKFAYEGSSCLIEFEYKITDPEWAFDVKAIRLRLRIPKHYPCELITVILSESTLPVPLISYFNKEVKKFLEEEFTKAEKCNTYVCVGKILIRWLDRSILNIVINGLRRTKMILEAEKEGITLYQTGFSNLSNLKENIDIEADKLEVVVCGNNEKTHHFNKDESKSEAGVITQKDFITEQTLKGKVIEARIFWKDLNGNVGTLSFITVAITIRCAKCNTLSFLMCSMKQPSIAHCQKCSNGLSINISTQLAHQNANVIALLEPKGCIPLDCVLLSSKLSFTCLQCSKEATAENITYGVANKSWCYGCHSKFEFEVKTIRFVGDFNSISRENNSVPQSKQKKQKAERLVMVVEGQPLRENGTCRHYRKSYRWFRFPCCGKLYPCDLCHNDAEKEHEMKLANRMVCGFCSKEQPFQKTKPCINCNENVIRKKSQFWEGGKGCRDQVAMSRHDKRKHANSLMKTVSSKHVEQIKFKSDNKNK